MLKLRFKTWTVIPSLLAICILGFGLLIPLLGYYWDDWPAITTIKLLGVDAFWEFYRGERPFSAWTFILFGPIFGTSQITWHLFTLALRWLTVLGMWWCLLLIWPRRKMEVTWMAFLFAVYPVFAQQPVAVAFSQHWLTFLLYFVSIASMLLSLRKPGWYWPLTVISMLTSAVHMLTMEYFIGLELLRPLWIWIVLSEQAQSRQRIKQTLTRWLPYLLIVVGVVVWRLFFLETYGEDPNAPVLLFNFFSQPVETSFRFIQLVVQELLNTIFGVWYTSLESAKFALTDRVYMASLGLGMVSAALLILYLLRLELNPAENQTENPGWQRQALLAGILATLLGSLPAWITDRFVLHGLYGGRFGLAAMFGLSILIVGLLEWFTPRRWPKILLIGLLVGVSVSFHLRSAAIFVRSWSQQNSLYWQLYWRAPYLEPGTALVSTDELVLYVGRDSTALALNLVYPQPKGSTDLAYWFIELPRHIGPKRIPNFVSGMPLERSFRNYTFHGSSLDGLAIFYEPAGGRCLWVLSPLDRYNPEIPGLTEEVLPVSNLSRIVATPATEQAPPEDIFGREPSHTWCYYYQKADLARQLGDWSNVATLIDEALAKGYKPGSAHEWEPAIEGYAHTGRWEEAINYSQHAFEKNQKYNAQLCYLWERMDSDLAIPPEFSGDLAALMEAWQCVKESLAD
ncbi:MAG TPA: hypothetical protein VLA49_21165 [Anaerolineales bacterium]|nr:hypothetical protein [Anaerolineales bacterium]